MLVLRGVGREAALHTLVFTLLNLAPLRFDLLFRENTDSQKTPVVQLALSIVGSMSFPRGFHALQKLGVLFYRHADNLNALGDESHIISGASYWEAHRPLYSIGLMAVERAKG